MLPPLESLTSSNEEPDTYIVLHEVASRVSVKLNSEEKETKGEPSSTTRDDAKMTTRVSSSSPPTLSTKNASGSSDQQTITKEGLAKVTDAKMPENDSKNDRTTSTTALVSADALDDDLKGKASCNIEQESTHSAINYNNSAEEGNAKETGRLSLAADAGSPPNDEAIENKPTSSTSAEVPIAKVTQESLTQTTNSIENKPTSPTSIEDSIVKETRDAPLTYDRNSFVNEMEEAEPSSTTFSNTYASKYATAMGSMALMSPMNVNHAGYISDSDDDAFNNFMSFMYSKPEENVVRKRLVKPNMNTKSHELDFDETGVPTSAAAI